jgi:hypothetical protein
MHELRGHTSAFFSRRSLCDGKDMSTIFAPLTESVEFRLALAQQGVIYKQKLTINCDWSPAIWLFQGRS